MPTRRRIGAACSATQPFPSAAEINSLRETEGDETPDSPPSLSAVIAYARVPEDARFGHEAIVYYI
jgi:hypothetical protein